MDNGRDGGTHTEDDRGGGTPRKTATERTRKRTVVPAELLVRSLQVMRPAARSTTPSAIERSPIGMLPRGSVSSILSSNPLPT